MLGSIERERIEGRGPLPRRTAGRLARDIAATRVIDLVGVARGVTRAELLSQRRCSRQIAAARQLAMYLVHTLLGRTYLEVGQIFGRDRTTVSHACARVEDLREDRSAFEREVDAIEAAVAAAKDAEARRAAR
jgi:chromosomal replication initiation ATPase DnaA